MLITKISAFSGKEHTRDIPVDEEKYTSWAEQGRPTKVQNEFPELNAEDREFIISGVTSEEWDEILEDQQMEEEYEEEYKEPDYEEEF